MVTRTYTNTELINLLILEHTQTKKIHDMVTHILN